MVRTTANDFMTVAVGRRRLPKKAPMLPPMSAATASSGAKMRDCLEAAEMAEKACDGIHQDEQRRNGRDLPYPSPLQKQEEGLRNMPPPTPVSPDKRPSNAPKIRAAGAEGCRISVATCSVW